MRIDDLRDKLQDDLDPDFDELMDAYVKETGSSGLRGFAESLVSRDLLSAERFEALISEGLTDEATPAADETPAPPPWTGGATAPFRKPTRNTDNAHAEASEDDPPGEASDDDPPGEASGDDPPGEASGDDPPGEASEEGSPAGDAAASSADDDTPQDSNPSDKPGTGAGIGTGEFIEDDKKGRTMFRRATGGALKETGDQRKRKRRRRRKKSEPSSPIAEDPDRYNFLGTVGEGAMGRIILAKDKKLHRNVAFKAMSDEIAEHATLADKFTCEAQITAQLDHPNIVPVYNLESKSAYTMKLIKGRTVEDIILECINACMAKKPADAMSLNERLELFLRACDAMHYANTRGVVHRDLKPENIMVGEFNELYIMDWGIARLMPGEFEDPVDLGEAVEEEGDFILGTPGYMSPEQSEGMNSKLRGTSDQYSLGLILFELVSLRQAVTGKTPLALVTRHQEGEKDRLIHLGRDKIPAELAAIIHKATHIKPERRYVDARALGEDLKRFMRGDAVLAKPDNPIQKLLRWMGKHRQLTATAAVMTLMFFVSITFVIIIISVIQISKAQAREQTVSNLLTMVQRQGSLIDGQFLKYEGLLSVIATTAVDNLTRRHFDQTQVFMESDYDEGDPDIGLIDSERYGNAVSITHPVYVLAEGVAEDKVQFDIQQLSALSKHYRRVLLRSHSEDAATYTPKRAQRALTDVGVPIAWAYVGLDNGVLSLYPGHGEHHDGYDHRVNPWFEMAENTHGPVWGAPSLDMTGLGLKLTCAQALYTDDDESLGVAGIDVTFDYIIEELLVAPEFSGVDDVEIFLLDAEGRIVIRSSKAGKEFKGANTGKQRQIRMPDFHHKEVVTAIKEKRSGQIEARGPNGMEMVIYTRMYSIGWYYVVAGDVGTMLDLVE
jgi:eukaryotic-like serine/threonine-protein kinase